MTDKVNPSNTRPAESFKTAGAIAYGGHGDSGFIVDSANPTDISLQDGDIDETQFNEFEESHTTSSFDVTIDPGEAFVFGSWLAIDTPTTVTLTSNTSNQIIYLGWNKDSADDVIIGLQSEFDNTSGNTDKKIPIWEFDTDGSGVTDSRNERTIGQTVNSFNTKYDSNSDGTIDASSLSTEEIQDIVGALIATDSNISVSYNDGADTLTISLADSISVDTLEATDVLTAPKYPTRSDVPDKDGIYRVEDVDGDGNFGIIAREL